MSRTLTGYSTGPADADCLSWLPFGTALLDGYLFCDRPAADERAAVAACSRDVAGALLHTSSVDALQRLPSLQIAAEVGKSVVLEPIGGGVDDDRERVLCGPRAHILGLDVLDLQAAGLGHVLDRHGSSGGSDYTGVFPQEATKG